MSALRHLRKTCRKRRAQVVRRFSYEYLSADASHDLARVYLDMRHGRQRDAMNRLERVLDAEAPHWRELA